jgi:adenosine deaminase
VIDLHNHLYGSLSIEMVYEMGKNNPSPRWELFTTLHEELYAEKIHPETFFQLFDNPQKMERIYYFNKKAPFIEFQSKFNLIIALSRFNIEEIEQNSYLVATKHFQEGIDYIEYRLMYSPFATREDYIEKTIAACKGLAKAEKENIDFQARLVLSLHREKGYMEAYQWLKDLMFTNSIVAKYLVGIDFCNVEEGFPPKDKYKFFQKVIQDNKERPEYALSILYHIAESYQDKTPDSAVRWIFEAAQAGAHRLGHCIALGILPEAFLGKTRIEECSERRDHLKFLIDHYEEISSFGQFAPIEHLKKEFQDIFSKQGILEYHYTEMEVESLRTFQNFTIQKLVKKGTVVESCPTSNLLIGMIDKPENLPVKRFSESRLNLTIGTDDPGIFNTNIKKEFELCASIGIPDSRLKEIESKSYQYKSSILSGRNKYHTPYPM